MRVRDMFNKEYLAAEDLDGRDVTLTIAKVVQEKLHTPGGDEERWVVHFQEMIDRARSGGINKRLVLNVTNGKQIAKVTGEQDADNWAGSKITIYPTTTKLGRDTVPCIRVRGK